MSHALALDSHTLALDLHALLRDLDPGRFKADFEEPLRERLAELEDRLAELTAMSAPDFVAALQLHAHGLSVTLREHAPDPELKAAELRAAWQQLRTELTPRYEALAKALAAYDIHVPALRPTNVRRSVFHIASGLFAVGLIEFVLTPGQLAIVGGAFMVLAWSMEAGRRLHPKVADLIMLVFAPVAHPHEYHRVNSATWYSTALFLLGCAGSTVLAALGVIVLGFADPVAGFIGRRWGRTLLINGRTLEGTLAFVSVGALAALVTLLVFHPGLGAPAIVAMSLAGAVTGGLAELVSRRIDDNLSIPLATAAGAGVVAVWLGVL